MTVPHVCNKHRRHASRDNPRYPLRAHMTSLALSGVGGLAVITGVIAAGTGHLNPAHTSRDGQVMLCRIIGMPKHISLELICMNLFL